MVAESDSKAVPPADYFQRVKDVEPTLSRRRILQATGLLVGASLLGVHGATPASAQVEPVIVNFGSLPVGQSRELCDPYDNTASYPVEIRIFGQDADQFSINGGSSVVIPARETVNTCITFAPTSEGEKTASSEVVNLNTGEVLEAATLVGTGLPARSPEEEFRELIENGPDLNGDGRVTNQEARFFRTRIQELRREIRQGN